MTEVTVANKPVVCPGTQNDFSEQASSIAASLGLHKETSVVASREIEQFRSMFAPTTDSSPCK
jgi:hypothetical protein